MTVVRVLLAAENEDFMNCLAAWLSIAGGLDVVGRARSAVEALARAERSKPQIVLVDATLRDMTGFEAARWLKTLRPAPVVVLTTFHDRKTAEIAAAAAGADGFVSTPEIPDRLLPKIAELLFQEKAPVGSSPTGRNGDPRMQVPVGALGRHQHRGD